jgi:hypothetical protein
MGARRANGGASSTRLSLKTMSARLRMAQGNCGANIRFAERSVTWSLVGRGYLPGMCGMLY